MRPDFTQREPKPFAIKNVHHGWAVDGSRATRDHSFFLAQKKNYFGCKVTSSFNVFLFVFIWLGGRGGMLTYVGAILFSPRACGYVMTRDEERIGLVAKKL